MGLIQVNEHGEVVQGVRRTTARVLDALWVVTHGEQCVAVFPDEPIAVVSLRQSIERMHKEQVAGEKLKDGTGWIFKTKSVGTFRIQEVNYLEQVCNI